MCWLVLLIHRITKGRGIRSSIVTVKDGKWRKCIIVPHFILSPYEDI